MHKLITGISVAVGLLSNFAWSLQMDQQQTVVDASRSIDYYGPLAQSFVPQSSQLAAIQVSLLDSGGALGEGSVVQLQLYSNTGQLLATSTTVELEDCFNFDAGPGCGLGGGTTVPVNFSFDVNLAVEPGESYTFELIQLSGTAVNAGYSYDDTYSNGDMILQGLPEQGDLAFVTFGPAPTIILVSNANQLLRYSTDGQLIDSETIDANPYPNNARDLVALDENRIAIFNGVFAPTLSIVDNGEWQHVSYSGWSTANNVSYGGLAFDESYIYATDMATAGEGAAKGVIRFEKNNPSVVERFLSDSAFIDITLGADGKLYALENSYGDLHIIAPQTMTTITTLDLGHNSGSRAVTADASGNIYMASWNGFVSVYNEAGVLQTSETFGGSLIDIDLQEDAILVTSRDGTIRLLDTSLAVTTSFNAPQGNAFAAFGYAQQAPPTQINYCESSGSNTNYEWIESFAVDNSVFNTGNNTGYVLVEESELVLEKGQSYLLELVPGFNYNSYTEYWSVWLDTNANGEFEVQEQLASGVSNSDIIATLTIPETAGSGETRLRVQMKYGGSPNACGTFYYGEVEDYVVEIQ